jgi:hypothetical protein
MKQAIKELDTRSVQDAQVVHLQCATYQDSEPFSGSFETFDLDDCYGVDPVSGKITVTVRCQWGDDADEHSYLQFVLHDQAVHGSIGFDGDVTSRIGYR